MDAFFGGVEPHGEFIDEFLSMTNAVSVNAKPSKAIATDPFRPQLVEFAVCDNGGAHPDVTLSDVFVGGHAAVSPKAGRSWRGAVAEAVFIVGDAPPEPEDLNAVRRYLAARHRLAGVGVRHDPETAARLSAMGVRTFAAFSTTVIVR